jgi:hypothetical protein
VVEQAQKPNVTLSGRRRRRWRRVGLVIALGALAGFALVWYAVQGGRQPVFDATLEGAYPDISRAMQAVAATTPDGASMSSGDLFRIVTRSGFRRLDDQSVLEFVQLRANLAQTDDAATCAELWSGNTRNLVPAIEAQPNDQQRQWAELFDHAALATINNLPIMPSPTADLLELGKILGRDAASWPRRTSHLIRTPQLRPVWNPRCQVAPCILQP